MSLLVYEPKVFNAQTRKLNLSYLLCQSNPSPFSVSRNSLCYRVAKLINCLLEIGLGTVDCPTRMQRKTLKHMQLKIVKNNFEK